MPGPQLLDLHLVFTYNGVKATQYFTKFTQESLDVFRNDLTALKLPHPKKEHTTFVSHGHVECFWYGAQKDGVLHRHIRDKIQPSTAGEVELLRFRQQVLSIGHILFKQIQQKSASNTSTKRPNPYAQKPSNEQEGSRPSKVARTELTQRSRTMPTPPEVQPSHAGPPFSFMRLGEPQSRRQPATNSNDSATTPTTTALPTPPSSNSGTYTFVSDSSRVRCIRAPVKNLLIIKGYANELDATALPEPSISASSGQTRTHTDDSIKQVSTVPKASLALRKDSAPIQSSPNPQVPAITHQGVTSTHGLPQKPPALHPRRTSSRFSESTIPTSAMQGPTTTTFLSTGHNGPASLPPRPTAIQVQATTPTPAPWVNGPASLPPRATVAQAQATTPTPAPWVIGPASLPPRAAVTQAQATTPTPASWVNGPASLRPRPTATKAQTTTPTPAPWVSSHAQGIPAEELPKQSPPTPPLPGLWQQQTQDREQEQQMQKSQDGRIQQMYVQPPRDTGFQRRQKQRLLERSQLESQPQPQTRIQTRFDAPPMALPTPTTPSTANARVTVKTEPGLESERAFTPPNGYPPSERVSVRQNLVDPFNPFEVEAQDQDRRKNLPSKEVVTSGPGTGANIIVPWAMRDTIYGKVEAHPPTRPRGVRSNSFSKLSALSASASSATNTVAIQRLTREAWDVKRQISASVERERAIIDELAGLGSRWVPEATTVDSGPNGSNRKRKREGEGLEGDEGGEVLDGGDSNYVSMKYFEDQKAHARSLVASLRMRLTKAESAHSQIQSTLSQTQSDLTECQSQLKIAKADSDAAVTHYRSKLSQVQSSLAHERRLRKEAEDAIADVRRECVKPFVVPSLLDAFVEISKLTTRAMVSAEQGAAKGEVSGEERSRSKGVDMGPTTAQRNVSSLLRTMEAGDVQHCHTDTSKPSPASADPATYMKSPRLQTTTVLTTAPMEVVEAQRLQDSADSPSKRIADGISGTSAGATTPRQNSPSDMEDVDMRVSSPIPNSHKDLSSLPTTTVIKNSGGQPNEGHHAQYISGEVASVTSEVTAHWSSTAATSDNNALLVRISN